MSQSSPPVSSPLDLVPFAVLGGEEEDRGPVAVLAQRLADAVAVHAGHHDVEDDGVIVGVGGHGQAGLPVVGDVDDHPLGLETASHAVGEPHLIVHHQNPHGGQSLTF